MDQPQERGLHIVVLDYKNIIFYKIVILPCDNMLVNKKKKKILSAN